mgnify:CR=1 FL=1
MDSWLNHPGMQNIDPVKLELIKTAVSQTSGKTGNALAPILLSLITTANKKGIQFSPDEVSLIMEMMKDGKSPSEKAQIDKTAQMAESFLKKHRR